MRAWIGTSGWVYGDWRGRVYPPEVKDADRLAYFATRFPTVEINASFYRLPPRETFVKWRRQTPSSFCFAVKMSRYVTHVRRLREPGEGLERFWQAAGGLGPKRGPVLVQLPPTFRADVEVLERFLERLEPDSKVAFEFRHESWDTDDVRRRLASAGVAWVLADRPGLVVPLHVTATWSYVRFHQGRPASSGYPRAKLRRWADRLASMPVEELFVYFNNDPGGAAVRDAETLTTLLSQRGVEVATAAQPASVPP
jgi:uncharacterized protein YecE (DUF72 family)